MRYEVFQRICKVLREHLFIYFRVPSSPCVQKHPENLAHASPQPFVVPHGKSLRECRSDNSDLVVGPATCIVKEQSPRALDVLHRWDALQKSAMIAQNSIQVGCNEVWVTKRCSQNFDALQLSGQSRTLPHCLSVSRGVTLPHCLSVSRGVSNSLEDLTGTWLNTTGIPHFDLPEMNSYVRMPPELLLHDGAM